MLNAIATIPEEINDLINSFSEETQTSGSIPVQYREETKKACHGQGPVPDRAFSNRWTDADAKEYWEFAWKIFEMATSTSEFSSDEQAWYSVVEEILKFTQYPLDVVPSQLKALPAVLLPTFEGAPLPTVKIDFSSLLRPN